MFLSDYKITHNLITVFYAISIFYKIRSCQETSKSSRTLKYIFSKFLPCFKIIVFNVRRKNLTDLKIIEECRGGNLNSFRELIETTSPFAFSLAFRMLGDEEQAKDVVQEMMITIWQKLNSIKSAEAYRTWVYRIVLNRCYDELRKRKRSPELTADDKTWKIISDTVSDGEERKLENEEIAAVIGILTKRLSPGQKAVFILADLEGLTHDEIAAATGMRKSVIKSNLHYARENISKMIKRYR
jgi:RNA polymerase sigma-70 factor (ECF subfamily)